VPPTDAILWTGSPKKETSESNLRLYYLLGKCRFNTEDAIITDNQSGEQEESSGARTTDVSSTISEFLWKSLLICTGPKLKTFRSSPE
jgi:hypothetical protein